MSSKTGTRSFHDTINTLVKEKQRMPWDEGYPSETSHQHVKNQSVLIKPLPQIKM